MAQVHPDARQRLARTFILLLCLGTLFFACLRVIGHGYFPSDDALRHVGKAISGKPWGEILVVRPEITMDSHPGWHAVLTAFLRLTGASSIHLLNFSVIVLFLLFMLPPAFLFRRSEAWIASLALISVFSFGPLYRLLFGRPFIFTMFVILMFCFLWQRFKDNKTPFLEMVLFAVLSALSTWIHGTWYLLSLPLVALFLAREWRAFVLMGISVACGILLGAFLTGAPLAFLHQMVFHALEAFGKHDFQRQLVMEFQPFSGDSMTLVIMGGLLLWRRARGEWNMACVDNPVFILGAMGWVMGFFALRFWTDWGWPAVAFWVASELQSFFEKKVGPYGLKRIALTAVLCLVLFLSMTSDWGSRWSSRTLLDWPSVDNPEQRPWLPGQGGILYSDNMRVFYYIFFQNPHGPWKYILGFEPTWMPEDELEIYRRIQLGRGKDEAFAPWVEKMGEKDRLVLVRTAKPTIQGLEWHEVTPTVWSGRVPGQQPSS